MSAALSQPEAFHAAYRGIFLSLLRWEDLDALWNMLRAEADGWHLYAIGESPPTLPSPAADTRRFIDAIDALLRADHRESYCSIVYVDDKSAPRFVKIYDPNRLGSSCGASGDPPLPGWIMSRLRPAARAVVERLTASMNADSGSAYPSRRLSMP